MKIGLYGYEGSGATTLYNAITGLEAPTGAGGKQQINVGTVKVPEPRLYELSPLYNPKKIVHAEIVFNDFPVSDKEKGQSGRALPSISDVRAMDMLCLVIRDFESPYIERAPDAMADLEEMFTEMVLLDMEVLERYLERQQKIKERDPFLMKYAKIMVEHLETGQPLRTKQFDEEIVKRFKGFALLTLKPLLLVINRSEENIAKPIESEIAKLLEETHCQGISLCASVEADISSLPAEEQGPFLEDMGLDEPIVGRFVRAVYDMANFISFFTVGPDEVRAWPIQRGTNARRAAGTIHSDLERGFIRAEVFEYTEVLEAGSEQQLKKEGKLRLEGKEYEVKDGDVICVRFNV